ncbi:MAG: VWA domain-containing protein [Deltaproteobacteria bacterium]|nr:VWA domain-containing protein [Deltaproteobacteria bacterium]
MINIFSNLTFAAPHFFWLLPLLLAICWTISYQKNIGFLSVIFRSATFTLLITALAQPEIHKKQIGKEMRILADVSYSISAQARASFSQMLAKYLEANPDVSFTLSPFAKSPLTAIELRKNEDAKSIDNKLSSALDNIDTGVTNLAAALETLNNSSINRPALLFSDGWETAGDALKQAQLLTANDIHVYPLIPSEEDFSSESLTITALNLPYTITTSSDTDIRIAIKNTYPDEKSAKVLVYIDDKQIAEFPIKIKPESEKLIVAKFPKTESGLHKVRAALYNTENSEAKVVEEKYSWISVKELDKILLISDRYEEIEILEKLLSLKGFTLTTLARSRGDNISSDFSAYATIVLNNIAKQNLPNAFLDKLTEFVQKGGALINIGGDQSFGLGGYIDTPLEIISPVKFIPPQTTKKKLNNAVILLIDKSRSMVEENKMGAAKSAALSSIQSLKDDDYVGVIGFDSAPFVIIRTALVNEVKENAEHRLRNLTAAGQTNPLPALAAARQSLANTNAGKKHIIMLSDGQFPIAGGEYEQELDRISEANITLSTIALGKEADIPLLKMFASYCRGAFYQTIDASTLPEIFIRDIKVATGEKTMHEQENYVVSLGKDGLSSTQGEDFPPLTGFVETTMKPNAHLELAIEKGDKSFPLLASWQYGQGSVISFTSDISGRWSLPWLKWKQLVKFWSELFIQLKNKNEKDKVNVDFDLRYSIDKQSINLDLAIFDPALDKQNAPKTELNYISPKGSKNTISFTQAKKGRFLANIQQAQAGDYKLNITYGKFSFPPLAINIPTNAFGERQGQGLNIKLLSDLAYLTGGKINPELAELKTATSTITKKTPLHPPLIILASLLIVIEAFIREKSLATIILWVRRLFSRH